jgi:hypothetical protein
MGMTMSKSSLSSSSDDEESSKINSINHFIYIMQLPLLNLIERTKIKIKIAKNKTHVGKQLNTWREKEVRMSVGDC